MAKPDFGRLIGVPLGVSGQSRLPVVDAFRVRRVSIHPVTVARLRRGDTTGTKKTDQLLASNLLAIDAAPAKGEFFLSLTQRALDRRENQRGYTAHRLSSDGYLFDVARDTGLHQDVLRRLLRGMRADLVYRELASPKHPIVSIFLDTVEQYFQHYTTPPSSRVSAGMVALGRLWQNEEAKSIRAFYSLFNRVRPNTRATFVPYEMGVFHAFFAMQAEAEYQLTGMDKKILEAYRNGELTTVVARKMREATSIPIDEDTIDNYRNVILHASPIYRQEYRR